MEPLSGAAIKSFVSHVVNWLKSLIFDKAIEQATSPLKAANAVLEKENGTLKHRIRALEQENGALKSHIRELEVEISRLNEVNANYDAYEPFKVIRGVTVYREKMLAKSGKSSAFFCTHCYEARQGIFTIQRYNLHGVDDKRVCHHCRSEYIISVEPREQRKANTDYKLFE